MRELSAYLDRLFTAAKMDPKDERRYRGEMTDHLEQIVRDGIAKGRTKTESLAMALEAFGQAESVGVLLDESQNAQRPFWRKNVLILKAACITLFFGWAVNTFAYEVYFVAGRSVEPRLEQGSRVIVEKWNHQAGVGDIVAYREGERTFLGVVDGWDSPDRLVIHRNGVAQLVVEKPRLVGRVVYKVH